MDNFLEMSKRVEETRATSSLTGVNSGVASFKIIFFDYLDVIVKENDERRVLGLSIVKIRLDKGFAMLFDNFYWMA